MICILKLESGAPAAWITATDMHDARRKAEAQGDMALAEICYRMEFMPPPGMYSICDYWFLVGSSSPIDMTPNALTKRLGPA